MNFDSFKIHFTKQDLLRNLKILFNNFMNNLNAISSFFNLDSIINLIIKCKILILLVILIIIIYKTTTISKIKTTININNQDTIINNNFQLILFNKISFAINIIKVINLNSNPNITTIVKLIIKCSNKTIHK